MSDSKVFCTFADVERCANTNGLSIPARPTDSAIDTLLYIMKLTGQIVGSGKLGNVIVSKVAGESIARQYNPNVSNPSTIGQVAQRAKLKLASQLSAALEPAIVIPKKGLVSARNQFVKKAMPQIVFSGNTAQVTYENLQLTDGNTGLPAISAARGAQKITMKLASGAPANIDRVVWNVFGKSAEGKLSLVGSIIASDAGQDRTFDAETPVIGDDVVIYAYGMSDTDASASARYANYNCETGVDIAKLVASRSLSTSDFKFTETRGATLFTGETQTSDAPAGTRYVYITAGSGGSVSGTGFSNGRKAVQAGEAVEVNATPASGYTFDGWYLQNGGQQTLVSQTALYSFTMGNNPVDLIAVFQGTGGNGGGGFESEGD